MKRTTWGIGALVIVVGLLGAVWVASSDPSLIVRVDPDRPEVVLRRATAAGKGRVLHQGAGPVTELEVAPTAERLALLELVDGVPGPDGYREPPRSHLRLLDGRGRLLHSVDDVWHFTWSPAGDEIAYVTGSYYEGGFGFEPEAVHLLDVASARSRQLPGLDDTYQLHWLRAAGEDALYARTLGRDEPAHVRRYDMKQGQISRPDSPAFHFSPDGRYYLLEPHEAIELGLCSPGRSDDSCLRVFERDGDRPVDSLSSRRWGEPIGWTGADGHRLLFGPGRGRGAARLRVVDASAARELSESPAPSLGAGTLHMWQGPGREPFAVDRP